MGLNVNQGVNWGQYAAQPSPLSGITEVLQERNRNFMDNQIKQMKMDASVKAEERADRIRGLKSRVMSASRTAEGEISPELLNMELKQLGDDPDIIEAMPFFEGVLTNARGRKDRSIAQAAAQNLLKGLKDPNADNKTLALEFMAETANMKGMADIIKTTMGVKGKIDVAKIAANAKAQLQTLKHQKPPTPAIPKQLTDEEVDYVQHTAKGKTGYKPWMSSSDTAIVNDIGMRAKDLQEQARIKRTSLSFPDAVKAAMQSGPEAQPALAPAPDTEQAGKFNHLWD